MNLEDCIREAAKAGATGIEFLPEQMLPDFPEYIGRVCYSMAWMA